jgi:hypothetical protein
LEQEYRLDGPATVEVLVNSPVPMDRDPAQWAPDAPGLYVIHVNNQLWYIGIAETSIRQRFQQRWKALKDLNVPASALSGRRVGWITLKSYSVPVGAIKRKAKGAPDSAYRPVSGKYNVLRILEQAFIKRRRPPANDQTERVNFNAAQGGRLTTTYNNTVVPWLTFAPGSSITFP